MLPDLGRRGPRYGRVVRSPRHGRKTASPRSSARAIVVGAVLLAGCTIGQAPTGEASGSPTVTVAVVARDLAFDPAVLRLPRGTATGITLDNRDPGILHNIAILAPDGAVAFRGETFAGIASVTYRVAPLPAGELAFICDVHPTMRGTVIVEARAPSGT